MKKVKVSADGGRREKRKGDKCPTHYTPGAAKARKEEVQKLLNERKKGGKSSK